LSYRCLSDETSCPIRRSLRAQSTDDDALASSRIAAPGKVSNRREWKLEAGGNGDGITIDAAGRVYVSSAPGVQIFSADGKYVGLIPTPRPISGQVFAGPDKRTLYIVGFGGVDGNERQSANAGTGADDVQDSDACRGVKGSIEIEGSASEVSATGTQPGFWVLVGRWIVGRPENHIHDRKAYREVLVVVLRIDRVVNPVPPRRGEPDADTMPGDLVVHVLQRILHLRKQDRHGEDVLGHLEERHGQ
jgi:hypothetical protein